MSDLEHKIITIYGGTGFLGRYVVRELAKTGALIRVVSRSPLKGKELKTFGYVGQIALEKGSILDRESVDSTVENSNIVINMVGILHEGGRQRFSNVHAQGAERIAQSAQKAGVERLIQTSALGVEQASRSKYARSKLSGDKAVAAAFPASTIIRPSVVFGPEDDFINRFASIAALSPIMPLIGGGHTRFQPVYAGDVAKAIRATLEMPKTKGKTYELGGPYQYSFKEILEYIMKETGHHRPFLALPFGIASLMSLFVEWLPFPPLTRDQVQLLKYDNVVSDDSLGFKELGLQSRGMEVICPSYLYRYRRGGQFNHETAA